MKQNSMAMFDHLFDPELQVDFEPHITSGLASRDKRYGGFLRSFFAECELSPESLAEDVRQRLEIDVEPRFVSTVVRGLAGSTSDIDIVGVGAGASQAVSAMMFWGGRRIGLKAIDINVLQAAREELQEKFGAVKEGSPPSTAELKASKFLKRVDLERLINSFSLTSGADFLPSLPALSRIAALESRREAAVSLAAAHWAMSCAQSARARAYLEIFVINVMDCAMALCGDVQTNTKWTKQRWSIFTAEQLPNSIAAVAEKINAIDSGLKNPHPQTELQDQNGLARSVFKLVSSLEGSRESYETKLSEDVNLFDWMPGSTCISGPSGCVIVDTGRLNELTSVGGNLLLESDCASLALDLLSCAVLDVSTASL
jgi:hypothetical protein